MDFMKEFKEYLPKWSEEKMQPIPTEDTPDRWSLAWKDFMNEYLSTKRDEIIAEYKAMKFKTKGDLKKEPVKEVVEEIPKNEPELSEWEKVKAMLDGNL